MNVLQGEGIEFALNALQQWKNGSNGVKSFTTGKQQFKIIKSKSLNGASNEHYNVQFLR